MEESKLTRALPFHSELLQLLQLLNSCRSLLSPLQFCQHPEILKRRGVSCDLSPGCNFFQQTAHYFPAPSLWQCFRKTDIVRLGNRPDCIGDVLAAVFLEVRAWDGLFLSKSRTQRSPVPSSHLDARPRRLRPRWDG